MDVKILKKGENMNLDFVRQIVFIKRKMPTQVQKFAKFKNKSSIEYNASLSLRDILESLIDKNMRDTNKMIETLFRRLQANRMGLFTIVKFSLENYFASISLQYVYEFFIKNKINEKYKPLLENYCDNVKYNLGGLPPSNNFADIMSQELKNELFEFFRIDGLTDCFYYINDFVLLFKKRVNQIYIKFGILECIKKVFYKRNQLKFQNKIKTHIDESQYTFLDDTKLPGNFVWLGYKIGITYGWQGIGITLDIEDIIMEHYRKAIFEAVKNNYADEEKMRLMLYSTTRRVVIKLHKHGKPNKNVSITPFKFYKNFKKYPELVGENTRRFMQGVVVDAFRQQAIAMPFYLKDYDPNSGYNLWHNFFANKAIVLNKSIGWTYAKLYQTMKKYPKIDIHSKSYDELAKMYIENFVIKFW